MIIRLFKWAPAQLKPLDTILSVLVSVVTLVGLYRGCQDVGPRNKDPKSWSKVVIPPGGSLCASLPYDFADGGDCVRAIDAASRFVGRKYVLHSGVEVSVELGKDDKIAAIRLPGARCGMVLRREPPLWFWQERRWVAQPERACTSPTARPSAGTKSPPPVRLLEALRTPNFEDLRERLAKLALARIPAFKPQIWRCADGHGYALTIASGAKGDLELAKREWSKLAWTSAASLRTALQSEYVDLLSDARVAYVAKLGPEDHCGPGGGRLTKAEDVVARDRERFRAEGKRDLLDVGDVEQAGGASETETTKLEICPDVERAILSHAPVVEVLQTRKSLYVRVLELGPKLAGCRDSLVRR